ncbi:porin [Vibrio sp. 10N.286.49.C2]|uniref:oligogalacturonate-specific porin KdgM family protein n=1 Tax=unclassified Vibrio TaxID=2614977 RepID=UPI000C863CDD|nr:MULTISPECIES: oligogalacturonate-specific porin KdgM family protein [unclassified Vibrio]PMH36759.1 porin [Vibrio sp. 10N.286.49.C2]PMH54747.1 porin [Vibrio sp. 10N.286.49.B1]PMH79544.1 porin [Vibrio sp. 10N.286.48.B7]
MSTFNKVTVALVSVMAAASVSAASVDFRQEYKNESGDYASRVKIGSSVGNHYFGVEAKQKGKPFSDLEAGDNEFEYGYNFQLDDHWRVQTSMPITFGNGQTTYKPQVRVHYKFDSGLTAKMRYRHEFRNYAGDNTATGRDDEQHGSLNRSKLTANLDYNWNAWQLGAEANYANDLINKEWKMGTNEEYEWDYNFKIGYKEADWDWRPYVEMGNVQYSNGDEKGRQLRARVGITYSF